MNASASGSGRRVPPAWLVLAALVPTILVCCPLVYVGLRSWEAGPAGVIAELARPRTVMLLVNTVALAVSVTVASVLIGTGVAWCVERTDLAGRRIWRVVAALPLAVPAFVSSYAWSSFSSNFENLGGAILILSLAAYPLVYLPVAAAIRGMDPAFEDVARALGRGPWGSFAGAVLPQARPAIGVGALLVLTHMFAEFGALAFLRVQTFTTAIFESYQLQFDSASAALQSGVLIAFCLPAALAETRIRSRMQVARVGRGTARRGRLASLGVMQWPVFALFALLIATALGVPLATLGYWLSVGRSAGLAGGELLSAVRGSLSLAVPGAFVVAMLALPLVLLSARYSGRASVFADRLPYVVHGLPGLVVALALVFISINFVQPLYQTVFVLLAAYAVLFLPLAQSALRASIELVPPRLEEIARSLGRGSFGAFVSVTLPNITPGIGAALALIALELMRELTATLMLAPIGVTTLATEVWVHTNDSAYAAAAPFAAMLVVVSALPVYFFTRRSLELYDI